MKRYSIALAACLILPGFGQSKGDFDEMQRRLDEVERQRRVEENRARQREIHDKLTESHRPVVVPNLGPSRRSREQQRFEELMELRRARVAAQSEALRAETERVQLETARLELQRAQRAELGESLRQVAIAVVSEQELTQEWVVWLDNVVANARKGHPVYAPYLKSATTLQAKYRELILSGRFRKD